MPKNRCKTPYYLIFLLSLQLECAFLKGTEKAFRNKESIQKEI